MSEITNPYRPGQPVTDPAMLFGRQDAADWVELQITNNARVLLVSGQPLIGKTSFIHHIATFQSLNVFNLLVSLPNPAIFAQPAPKKAKGQPVENKPAVIDLILQQVIENLIPQLTKLNLISSSPTDASPPPSVALRELFAQANQQGGQARLLLYMDDLHHFVTDDLALLSSFLSAFIPVLEACPHLHLVFTVNDNQLKHLRHPLLDGAPTFHLTSLTADAALNMITLPVKTMLRFDYGLPRRIAEVNSNHPYYLSLFCHTLLNRQGRDGWVNQRDFDAAMAEVLSSPIEPFTQTWEQSSPVERAVLAGMAAMQGKHGPMTQQEVIRFLQKVNETVVPEVVIEALHTLAERGILASMGAVSYRFYVDLLRFWLRDYTRPADALKEVNWTRLATQVKSRVQPIPARQMTMTSPKKRRALWSVVLVLLVILCLLMTGSAVAVRFLNVPLPFLTTPTATPTATPKKAISETNRPTSTPLAEPTLTPTPTPPPVVARTLPSITFMGRDIDQSWRIYVMDTDGANVTPLSPDGLNDTAPTWSPDGQKIAFVSQRDGNREIYVMEADCASRPDGCGPNAVNITRHPADDWTPAWSPDGKQVVFSSLRDGNWEIYTADMSCLSSPDTCRDRVNQLTADGRQNILPVWSPDGRRLAFSSKAGGNWDIYTMAADGTDIRQITTFPENDLSPVWSPDGTRLAFESNHVGNVDVYSVEANAAAPPQNITDTSSANDHGPAWSPDGQLILFYSNRAGNWDIFSTTLDGQGVKNLTQTPDRDEQTPAWRP